MANSRDSSVNKKKNIIYRKYIKEKNEQIKLDLHEEFKHYRNTINRLLRLNKSEHYQKFFTEHRQNLHKTWEGIKSVINISKKTDKSIGCLRIDGEEETDPLKIANSFNDFFSTIAQKIETKNVHTNKKFSDYLGNPAENYFFINFQKQNK